MAEFDYKQQYEERAAIKEFCGNMPRIEAERQARIEMGALYPNGCPIITEGPQRDDL